MDRRAVIAALAVLVVLGLGYWGRKLWLKSDDLLRPAVVLRDADAVPIVQPSIGRRLHAVFVDQRSPLGERPKLVALTFDDGPYPVTTPLLLQTLRDLRVPATFFLIGRDAEQFPALARAIAAGGHEIADHTLTHPNLDQLDSKAVTAELKEGTVSLQRIAPDPSELHLFRPPHGRYTLATIQAAQGAGYDTILWNDDPGDWRSVPPQELRDHLLRHATAPEIVLLHSGRWATVEMLPELVGRYRAAGYTFVTIGTLLRHTTVQQLNRPAKLPLAPAS